MYKLNRRITIHRYTTIKNQFGGLQAVETANWTKWAEARDRLGNSRNDYAQRQWTYDQFFVMRFEVERPTRSNDVIEYEGQFYKINYIQIQNEGNKEWEYIYATKLDESINSDAPMQLDSIQYYNYTGLGGESTFNFGSIIGKHVFTCFKDGMQYKQIASNTPSGKEVYVNTTTGDIHFGIAFEQDEIATILYY